MKLYIKAEGVEQTVDVPETDIVLVQARTEDGRPRSNTMIVLPSEQGLVMTSFVLPDSLVQVAGMLLKVMHWSDQHGGDMRGFSDALYAGDHPIPVTQPANPVTITPLPPPAPPPVVDAGLSAANARIVAYAGTRRIGAPHAGTFQIGPGWYGRNYEGGEDATGLCIVIDSSHGTWLVRNGFFANYTEKANPPRSKLGPPVEDEHGTAFGAEQSFEHGKLKWSPQRGVWAEPG